MELIKIENLSCGYNGKEILHNVSFSAKSGCFIGIIGPNGAGKSTLFRAITKIIRPFKGKIFYRDRELSNISVKDLSKEVAVLTHRLEMPFSFNVEELVLMGRAPHIKRFERPSSSDFEVVDRAIGTLDIKHLKDRNIKQLSSGEVQRVFLAQSLAQEPKLLLLDEPVSHLDIKHQVEILDLLKDLNTSGLSIIIILHDLNLASEYCSELILLNEGKIEIQGGIENVLRYEIIERVYKTLVVVEKNPISGKPYVLLVSKGQSKGQKGSEYQPEDSAQGCSASGGDPPSAEASERVCD